MRAWPESLGTVVRDTHTPDTHPALGSSLHYFCVLPSMHCGHQEQAHQDQSNQKPKGRLGSSCYLSPNSVDSSSGDKQKPGSVLNRETV